MGKDECLRASGAVALVNPISQERSDRAVSVLMVECPYCCYRKACGTREILRARSMGGQFILFGPEAVQAVEETGCCPEYKPERSCD